MRKCWPGGAPAALPSPLPAGRPTVSSVRFPPSVGFLCWVLTHCAKGTTEHRTCGHPITELSVASSHFRSGMHFSCCPFRWRQRVGPRAAARRRPRCPFTARLQPDPADVGEVPCGGQVVLATSSVPMCPLIPASRKKRELNITPRPGSLNDGLAKISPRRCKKQGLNLFLNPAFILRPAVKFPLHQFLTFL